MPKEQIFEIKKQGKPEVPAKETGPEISWSPEATKQGEKLVIRISSLKESLNQAEEKGDLKEQAKILDQIAPLTERLEALAKKEERETEIIAQTKEGQEIVFNLEKERQKWQDWYQEKHHFKKIKIPEIRLTKEQSQEIKNLVEQGYVDSCAIIAKKITYQDLEKEMSKGYTETYQNSDFKGGGGWQALNEKETKPGFRLVFYQKVKELNQDPILKKTLGKSAKQIKEFLEELKEKQGIELEGLFLKDYLVIQRKFTEETKPSLDIQDDKRHLDADNWAWCLKSSFPSSGRLARVYWYPYGHRLSVRAGSPSGSFLGRGARLGRGFEF